MHDRREDYFKFKKGEKMEIIKEIWAIIEPMIWLLASLIGAVYWSKGRLAKRRRYKKLDGEHIVAVQIGRPVAEAVKAHFNGLDALIEIESVLGKSSLDTGDDYKKIARAVYREIAEHQSCKIRLVVSGPVGLNCLIGQLIGLHHFDVSIYQFNILTKGYDELPEPDRGWL